MDHHPPFRANMHLHTEVPLPPLPRLQHLRIARPRGIHRRARRPDDRRIHDGPRAQQQLPVYELRLDRPGHPGRELMRLQQMAELSDVGLVRHRPVEQFYPCEAPH